MRKKLIFRRTIIIILSLLFLIGLPVLSWVGGLYIFGFLSFLIPPGDPGQNLNPTLTADIYWRVSFALLSIAVSISIIYLFWNPYSYRKSKFVPYLVFLVAILPFSAVNFAAHDMLMNRWAQALLDIVIVFIGITVILYLLKIKPRSPAGVALHSILIFIIVFEAILLPGSYAIIWALNWQGAISLATTKGFNLGWVSTIAGVISTVLAIMSYRRESVNLARDTNESKIILP